MPDGQRLYQLVNTYSFKLTEKTKIKISWPVLGNLYDVAMSALYVITDVNDRVMKFGGAYSSGVDLMKGDYTVKLQLQHSSHKALEALKDLQLSIAAQLGDKLKKLTLPVYAGQCSDRNHGDMWLILSRRSRRRSRRHRDARLQRHSDVSWRSQCLGCSP